MRQQAGTPQRPARSTHRMASFVTAVAASLFAMPVHAQTLGEAGGAAWVDTTIISVSAVLALWLSTTGAFAVARRMRWVSHHRYSRLSRGLQVACGGLLLMAFFMPYLAMHHPVVAVGLLVASALMALAFGAHGPHGARQ